ncbi:hypothetical protein CONPUDRAFT_83811 [Coniophora puteana RWD-64-598 SS2]|uniref:LIM zinc-binding domain-containing protein n=1 Tax=Coniophora puteana (strain RWD-64-598) TaxID=741705 RepID=A0A5M3MGZ7_CONPW|nr:uncharacterized protein CONPUDRAFT_83811 [Coniophora puteana RWD-64-598 SS2]EIW78383.1 hypothetical protein CONPUDRAFT_83811 [Coniophora puteana RWD-64-598 SS2]
MAQAQALPPRTHPAQPHHTYSRSQPESSFPQFAYGTGGGVGNVQGQGQGQQQQQQTRPQTAHGSRPLQGHGALPQTPGSAPLEQQGFTEQQQQQQQQQRQQQQQALQEQQKAAWAQAQTPQPQAQAQQTRAVIASPSPAPDPRANANTPKAITNANANANANANVNTNSNANETSDHTHVRPLPALGRSRSLHQREPARTAAEDARNRAGSRNGNGGELVSVPGGKVPAGLFRRGSRNGSASRSVSPAPTAGMMIMDKGKSKAPTTMDGASPLAERGEVEEGWRRIKGSGLAEDGDAWREGCEGEGEGEEAGDGRYHYGMISGRAKIDEVPSPPRGGSKTPQQQQQQEQLRQHLQEQEQMQLSPPSRYPLQEDDDDGVTAYETADDRSNTDFSSPSSDRTRAAAPPSPSPSSFGAGAAALTFSPGNQPLPLPLARTSTPPTEVGTPPRTPSPVATESEQESPQYGIRDLPARSRGSVGFGIGAGIAAGVGIGIHARAGSGSGASGVSSRQGRGSPVKFVVGVEETAKKGFAGDVGREMWSGEGEEEEEGADDMLSRTSSRRTGRGSPVKFSVGGLMQEQEQEQDYSEDDDDLSRVSVLSRSRAGSPVKFDGGMLVESGSPSKAGRASLPVSPNKIDSRALPQYHGVARSGSPVKQMAAIFATNAGSGTSNGNSNNTSRANSPSLSQRMSFTGKTYSAPLKGDAGDVFGSSVKAGVGAGAGRHTRPNSALDGSGPASGFNTGFGSGGGSRRGSSVDLTGLAGLENAPTKGWVSSTSGAQSRTMRLAMGVEDEDSSSSQTRVSREPSPARGQQNVFGQSVPPLPRAPRGGDGFSAAQQKMTTFSRGDQPLTQSPIQPPPRPPSAFQRTVSPDVLAAQQQQQSSNAFARGREQALPALPQPPSSPSKPRQEPVQQQRQGSAWAPALPRTPTGTKQILHKIPKQGEQLPQTHQRIGSDSSSISHVDTAINLPWPNPPLHRPAPSEVGATPPRSVLSKFAKQSQSARGARQEGSLSEEPPQSAFVALRQRPQPPGRMSVNRQQPEVKVKNVAQAKRLSLDRSQAESMQRHRGYEPGLDLDLDVVPPQAVSAARRTPSPGPAQAFQNASPRSPPKIETGNATPGRTPKSSRSSGRKDSVDSPLIKAGPGMGLPSAPSIDVTIPDIHFSPIEPHTPKTPTTTTVMKRKSVPVSQPPPPPPRAINVSSEADVPAPPSIAVCPPVIAIDNFDAPSGPVINVSGPPEISVSGPEISVSGPPEITFSVSGPDEDSKAGMNGNSNARDGKPNGTRHSQTQSIPSRTTNASSGFGAGKRELPRAPGRGGSEPNGSVMSNGRAAPSNYSAQGAVSALGRGLACGGCGRAIIGRVVSAMGQRWHPECFRCSVCGEFLEHVSSYERDGKAYCHLDYHENFAPRCYHCKTPVVEERFITLDDPALGKRAYHLQHFFCAECGDPFLPPSDAGGAGGEMLISGDGEFDLGDDDLATGAEGGVGFTVYKGYPYCEACHVRLRLPKCKKCKKAIRDGTRAVEALGGKWCWDCFVCEGCERPFEDPSFFLRDNMPFCEPCFSIILRNEI